MRTVNLQELGADAAGVVASAQNGDVLVVEQGQVVAVVSKPRSAIPSSYWREREAMLAEVMVQPEWDSTAAVSEDRDRT